MDATQQQAQASGALGAAQAVAPAQAVQTPPPQAPALTPPPAPTPPSHTPHDQVPRAYLDQVTDQAKRRKEKIRAIKSDYAKALTDLTATASERDAMKATAEAAAARLKTLADRMAEQALTASLKAEGLSEDAARLLLPSLRAHVEVHQETFEVVLKSDEIKKAAAHFKPQTPQPPASTHPASFGRAGALHQQAAAARAPSTAAPDQPLTPKQKLAAEINAKLSATK